MKQSGTSRVINPALFRKWMFIVMVATMLGGFTDIYNVVVVGASSLTLIPSLKLTTSDFGLLAAGPFIGSPIGAILIGPISDKFGRKGTFTYTMVAFAIVMFLSALVTNFYEIFVLRLAAGVVIGAELVVGYLLTSEYSKSLNRGRNDSLILFSSTAGAWTALILAYFLITPLGELQWRVLFMIGAVFPAIGFIIRARMPEPPRWSVAEGKIETARKDLAKIGLDPDSVELYGNDVSLQQRDKTKLIKKLIIPIMLPLFIVSFLVNIPIGGLGALGPLVFHSLNIPSKESLLYAFLTIQIPAGLGILFVAFTTDRIGRHISIYGGSIACGILFILAGYGFLNHDTFLFITSLILGAFSLEVALTTTYFLGAELYPISIRGTGQGVNVIALRMGGVIATYGGAVLLATGGDTALLYFFGIVMLVASPFAIFWLGSKIDTKKQELEYISQRLTASWKGKNKTLEEEIASTEEG